MEPEAAVAAAAETKLLLLSSWTLICSALVLFMQAGFCCLEAGAVRHKNSINVAVKNMVDLCSSAAAYFVVGYAVMFGADSFGLFGSPNLLLQGLAQEDMLHFLFQVTFCSTAATIVSGGVAERCRFLPYVVVSLFVGVLIYPIFGHWVWGGGWLGSLGFHDFAGSSVVHMIGGFVALAGIQRLGPRLGRFDSEGRPLRLPASSMPLMTLGVLILLFGWLGFNGGSAPLGPDTPLILVNTLMAACFGGLVCLLGTWAFGGVAAVDLFLNGVLGGLVAVTACADIIPVTAAAPVGIIGGVAVLGGTKLLERLRLDDAVGAFPVHGAAGVAGVLCTALFARPDALAALGMDRIQFLGVQALGAAACAGWGFGTAWLLWRLLSVFSSLRVGPREEQIGMNYSEHRMQDPLHDMAMSLSAASKDPESPVTFEKSLDSEYAPLARAAEDLLVRYRNLKTTQRRWAEKLGFVARQLESSFEFEQVQTMARVKSNQETDGILSNLLNYLQSNRAQHSFFPIITDSLSRMRNSLSCPPPMDSATQATTHSAEALAALRNLAHEIRGGKP